MSRNQDRLQKILHWVERGGNALPHPAILFLWLFGIVLVLSAVISGLGIQAIHPVKKEAILPVNLLSIPGLHLIITDMTKNFTSFAPLGTVLVAILGFSLAEKSGLLSTLLRIIVLKAPRALLVPAVLLAGVLSHTAGDVGYVLLIPLAALAFHGVGMHPLAGLAICFAGVSGGFSANFLISTLDPLMAGLSQEAARILDPKYSITPLVNWYFMATSSLLIIGVGTLVANKITIPFLGKYKGEAAGTSPKALDRDEKRGLLWASIVLGILTSILLAGLVPEGGFLRDPKHAGDVLHSPVFKGVPAVIFFFGALCGLAYGKGARVFKSQTDVVNAMQEALATLAPYLVLVFFAAQFISFFNASNIGLIMAIHGADALKATGLGSIWLMVGFILLTVLLDLFIGSASAKWALMAPVFVPMFMLLGIAPELAQAAYRIGDSVVNIISPLMSYFPLILAFAIKYDPKARVGTVIALMLPYSVAFLITWSIMLFVWMSLELPLGPGGNLWYRAASG